MPSPRRIDFHFHLIPQFYKDAAYASGAGPAIGRYPDWSPDSQKIAFITSRYGDYAHNEMVTLPRSGAGEPFRVSYKAFPQGYYFQGVAWSPDGKKIAYAWREAHNGTPEELRTKKAESVLVVCDPDGKNRKTIATEKGSSEWLITIGHLDWGFVAADDGK